LNSRGLSRAISGRNRRIGRINNREPPQGERIAEQRHQAALERRAKKAATKGVPVESLPEPERKEPKPVRLADGTIERIMAPVKALFLTARKEHLIRHNPASEASLPHREEIVEDEDQDVKTMDRQQLQTVLALLPNSGARTPWRLFFTFLGTTGLRISEARALQWKHLQLDGSKPHVKVRRAFVKGRMKPPKSKYGRRSVPLSPSLVSALCEHRKDSEWDGAEDIAFPSMTGTILDPGNVYRRVLKPAAEEADVARIGFHSFRHICATILFDEGRNVKQVQRWLGHHSPTFTLNTYIHLLGEDLGEALEIAPGANNALTDPTPDHTGTPVAQSPDMAP